MAVVATACRGEEFPPLPSPPTAATAVPTSPPVTSPTGSTSPSPTVIGNVATGSAVVTATGGLSASATFDELVAPGIWTLPPGAIGLRWRGPARQTISISGPSFTAQLPTDIDRVLEFTLLGPAGLQTFRSSGGECLVTISPALADQVGGSFTCSGLTNDDGTVTVSAQGTFSAE